MKHILNKIIRNVKSVKGNSLAEFATNGLMATLALCLPKLSEMSEGAKGEKSRNEIDKIIKQAGQFYQIPQILKVAGVSQTKVSSMSLLVVQMVITKIEIMAVIHLSLMKEILNCT